MGTKAPSLGSTIKRLRSIAGLSQREFSQKLQIDPTYLSHLEADRREPSLQLLRRIATELAIPPGVLIALALWAELPENQQEQYRQVVEQLLELAASTQIKLLLQ
jgi:transcriptional regulator with XRE-family HTH domain